jgi:Asp-tRNA(Asn)/Glu-tRNA(Gln) amidotransferase B subunit
MGYQITQYHNPTMTEGQLNFFPEDFLISESVHIKQIQMETDTAKAIHTQ